MTSCYDDDEPENDCRDDLAIPDEGKKVRIELAAGRPADAHERQSQDADNAGFNRQRARRPLWR